MKRLLWVLLVGFWAGGTGLAEVTFSQSPLTNRYFVLKLTQPVKVDGRLKEWDFTACQMVVDQAECEKTGIFYTSEPNKQHAAARCLLAWDDEAMYVAAHIEDDSRCGLTGPPSGDQTPWSYDVLFLRLAPFGRAASTDRYPGKQIMPQAPYPQIPWVYYEASAQPWPLPDGINYVAVKASRGWDVEARIAFQAIGFQVQLGDMIRFAWELVDHDVVGGKDLSTSLLWKNWVGFGAPSHLAANEVAGWPELRFMGPAGVAGDLTTDRRYYEPSPTVVVKGEIDALAPGARADRIELLVQGTNQVIRTVAMERALPSNQSTSFVVRLDGKDLPPGGYTLRLVCRRAGQKAVATADFCIQEAPRQAVATVGERPGVFEFNPPWQLPEDPTRWWYNACDKPPDRYPVTSNDYLRLLQELIQADWDAVQGWFGPDQANVYIPYGFNNNLPLIFYTMYQETGEKVWGERTVECLKTWHRGLMKEKKCWFTADKFAHLVLVWRGLKRDGLVTDQDEATWWKEAELANATFNYTPVATPLEYGAMNRSMSVAAYLGYIAKRYPDYPEAAAYQNYYETVWNQWWPYRDGDENSSNYNPIFLAQVLAAAELMGHEEIFQDPGFRQYCERLLLYQSPCGAFISFGDDQSLLRGLEWIGLFEHLAAKLQDGRYRAAAHNLFNFRRDLPWRLRHFERNYHGLGATRTALAEALFWSRADQTPPQPIDNDRCRVLTRKLALPLSPSERTRRSQWFEMTDQVVPDKLILASGSGVPGLFATVELCPGQGHGHPSAPAVNGMVMFEAALLGGVQYVRKEPEWHNLLWIEDLEGVQPLDPLETITVPTFLDQGRAAFAEIDVEPYKSLPVRHRRSIWFLKDRLAWVRDEARYQKPFLSRLGPVWNTRCVAPEVGEHWANTYIDISVRGPLTGSRDKPWEQCHPEPNYNWDLLVWFRPQPDCRMTIKDRSLDDPYLVAPQRIRYQWQGLPTPDQPVCFDTILMPHEPGPRARPYADRIKVLANADGLVALEINYEVRTYNRRGDERLVLVWNTTGRNVQVADLETDAQQAYVATGTDLGTQKPYTYVWMRQGKGLRYQGETLFEGDKPADRHQEVGL
jgi:hypothetical protein